VADGPPDGAEAAEAAALAVALELLDLLEHIAVPSSPRDEWLPERLSFLLARDNFRQCLQALQDERDISAGSLARALFEEAIRWSWVDEDQAGRRSAFIGAAAVRHRQVDEAGRRLGIDPTMYYGALVDEVLRQADDATKFPRQIEGQLEWGLGDLSEMLYTQYRLFSQYTHSSLLASASVAVEGDGELRIGRLPIAARGTVLRNAVSNMAVIMDGCKDGLVDQRPRRRYPLNAAVMSYAVRVAEILYAIAPATD
jgi:hypothetical protein